MEEETKDLQTPEVENSEPEVQANPVEEILNVANPQPTPQSQTPATLGLPDLGFEVPDVTEATQNVVENATAEGESGLSWVEENISVPVGSFLSGRDLNEEAQWRVDKKQEFQEASDRFKESQKGTVAQETVNAAIGGAADAAESIGSFAELSGDTLKTGWNQLFGKPTDSTQNPWSQDYIHGDAGFLDIPDHMVPENETGLGKLARGFVEFGVLMATTRGVGRTVGGVAKTGTIGKAAIPVSRAAGVGAAGSRPIQFIRTATKVGAEGAAAELISSSSEEANLLNLVDQTTPWMSPWVKNVIGVNALKVHPDDNPWLARIKTVVAGAGINLVGHTLSAFAKGKWAARQAKKNGMSDELANEFGNKAFQDEWMRSNELDERAANAMAADRFEQGRGIGHANSRDEYLRKYLTAPEYTDYSANPGLRNQLDELAETRAKQAGDGWDIDRGQSEFQKRENRQVDPFVNPRKFNDSQRATYRPDSDTPVRQNLKESIEDLKGGGEGRSYSPLFTEAGLNKMARGDINLREYIIEVANDISDEAFKELDNTLNWKEVQALIIKQASDLHQTIEGGGEGAAKRMKEYLKGGKDSIVWTHAGEEVVTGTAPQKAAIQLVVNTLAKQAEAISTGALHIADDVPINRQVEQVFDAMKVALIEQKKVGYMTGSELAAQKGLQLSPNVRNKINKKLAEITEEENQFFNALHALNKQGRHAEMRDLLELNALSQGDVRTLEHVHEWLKAKIMGGDMGGGAIKGRLRQELQGVFYNSILSSLKTPIKAVISTSMIATSRAPWQFLGASLKMDRKEMAIAWAGIDAMVHAWDESFDMAKYNWDLGVQRKNQTYHGRFDMAGDIAEFQALAPYYAKYGTSGDQKAYNFIHTLVSANTSPFMKYSANAMGSGDAWARTMIGRSMMRMQAAREALEQGAKIADVQDIAKRTEANYRQKIFKQNRDGKWVVHDKAAKMAGDEATMTKALEGWMKTFEEIQKVPTMRGFFPFVRTGVNAIDLTFQHTPLALVHSKYRHLKKGIHLDKYGLRPQDVPGELAMMEGRLAAGTGAMFLATVATWKGNMTGDYPYDKEGRDLWMAAKIPPYSFKVGNAWVSYRDLEPFNTVFSVAANLAQSMDVVGEDITDEWFRKGAFMLSAVLVDKSMLSGLKDLSKIAVGGEGDKAALRVIGRYARNRLPWAGLSAQIGTIMDANQKESNTLLEMLRQRDALWKSNIPAKYDILATDRRGKPLNYAAENPILRLFNSLSPIGVVPVKDDFVRQGLLDIKYNLPEIMANTPEGVPMTSIQRSELQRLMSIGPLRKDLERIMRSQVWQNNVKAYHEAGLRESKGDKLRHFSFYEQVDKAFHRAKELAWAQLVQNNPEMRNTAVQLKARKALAGGGPSAIQRLINLPYK